MKTSLFGSLILGILLLAGCSGVGGGTSASSASGQSRCGTVTKKPGITMTISDSTDSYDEAIKNDFGNGEGDFKAGKILRIFVATGDQEKTLETNFVTDKAENVTPGNKIPMTAVTKKQGNSSVAFANLKMTPMAGSYHVEVLEGNTVIECRQFTVNK